MKNFLLVLFLVLGIASLQAQNKPSYSDLTAFAGFNATYQQQTPFMVQGTKRGEKFVLKYNFFGQDVPPAADKVLNHYVTQLNQRKGKILTQQAGSMTFEFPKGNLEVWVQIKVLKPSAYEMIVIEKEQSKQDTEGIYFADAKDILGSKDYTLLPRYQGYIIWDYKEEDFYMGYKLAGYKYQINYVYADSTQKPPSDETIVNQYISYVKKYNGKILTNDGALATMEFNKDNINRWIQIGSFGNDYELIVVEKDLKKDYNAPIVRNKPYDVNATQKSQIVVADDQKIIDDKEVAMNQLQSTTPLDNTGRNFVVNENQSGMKNQESGIKNQNFNNQQLTTNNNQLTINNQQSTVNNFNPNIQITNIQPVRNYQPTLNNQQLTTNQQQENQAIAQNFYANQDKAGSKEYPLLPRLNGYIIAEYKEEDFYMGYKLAGYKYQLNYAFADENARPMSDESVVNQYINMVKKYGGKVLTNDGPLATLEFTKNNVNRWIQVGSFGRNYEVVIVEKDLKRDYSVPLASNKPYFVAPTQKNELVIDETGKVLETQTELINPSLTLIPDNERVKRNFVVNENTSMNNNQLTINNQTTNNYQQATTNNQQYTAPTATNNQQATAINYQSTINNQQLTTNNTFISAPTSAGSIEELVNGQISLMLSTNGRAIMNQINFKNEISAELREDASFSIYLLAMYLRNNPNKKFYIISHVAKGKDLGKDIALSERRAQVVVEELMKIYKFDKERIKPKGLGSLAPIANPKTDTGRDENDRIELIEQ
jgi:outer membrane protein OmpA-like peptidoglycan-associated protein